MPWIAGVLVAVGLVGTGALLAGPARGARGDVAAMQDDVSAQRALIERQLAVTETQLGAQREQLAISREQRDIARRQLAATDESLRLQRRLVELGEQILAQVREVNRKTPNTPPAPVGGLR